MITILKKALITGSSGTVGTALNAYLTKLKTEVIPWDRNAVPIDDVNAMTAFIQETLSPRVFRFGVRLNWR